MTTFTLAAIGAGIVIALGVPLMERLVRRIWPMTPEQRGSGPLPRTSTEKYR